MPIADLREKLEDNHTVVIVAAGVLIALCLIWIVVRLLGGGSRHRSHKRQ